MVTYRSTFGLSANIKRNDECATPPSPHKLKAVLGGTIFAYHYLARLSSMRHYFTKDRVLLIRHITFEWYIVDVARKNLARNW